MKDEEIDKMADDFVNAQEFTKPYGLARKAECGAFWKYGFLAGLKAGRPQWHFVEDGDLPKHNHEVLCLMWGGTKEIGYYENEVWHFENFVADYEDVDYWQEIVPPKESE